MDASKILLQNFKNVLKVVRFIESRSISVVKSAITTFVTPLASINSKEIVSLTQIYEDANWQRQ